jgi:hypothetical protein
MGAFQSYLVAEHGKNHRLPELLDDAAEFLQHGVRSMIAEGQNPNEVYHKAIPIFGENFLIEAGIVEIVNGEEQK